MEYQSQLLMKVLDSLPALESLIDKRWQSTLESGVEALRALDQDIDFNNSVPSKHLIFKAFECDPKDVSVVIFGQDPYPDRDHAMGLAFSVDASIKKLPASLKNIYLEMQSDVGGSPSNGDLTYLSKQGVMLLNRGLTFDLRTKKVNPMWYQFTEHVARSIADLDAVGIFWGNQAKELSHFFKENRKVVGVHPSPLSAYRGFFGSKPFSRVNTLLQEQGKKPIEWTKQ